MSVSSLGNWVFGYFQWGRIGPGGPDGLQSRSGVAMLQVGSTPTLSRQINNLKMQPNCGESPPLQSDHGRGRFCILRCARSDLLCSSGLSQRIRGLQIRTASSTIQNGRIRFPHRRRLARCLRARESLIVMEQIGVREQIYFYVSNSELWIKTCMV